MAFSDQAILAVELGFHDGASAKMRYVTDADAFITSPTDTPPSVAFLPRILGRGVYSINAISPSSTFGVSEAGFGNLELANIDGGLDSWVNDGVSGRSITIRRGLLGAAYPSAWTTIFVGQQAAIESNYKSVSITFADRQADLLKPLQTAFYLGNNALPAGQEGVADLKGKPKPRVYGRCRKVAPVYVNTSLLIYQVSDKEAVISGVFDGGAALTAGAAYASIAAMEATAPAAGQYRVFAPAGGPAYFRLGSTAAKVITADVDAAGAAANWTAAQLLKSIALDAGILNANINAGDVTALDTANSAVCGYYLDGTQSAMDAMNAVAASIGASFWTDALGSLRMFRLAAPSGSPVVSLTDAQIMSIDRQATQDRGAGVPAWRVEVNFQRYWKTQSTTETVGAAEASRADLAQEFRRVSSEDASIKTKHTNAPTLRFNTLLDVQSAAQTEADRLLALYKADRTMLKVTVDVPAATLALLTLGAVVNVTLPRFGCTSGKSFVLIGLVVYLNQGRADLTLWG